MLPLPVPMRLNRRIYRTNTHLLRQSSGLLKVLRPLEQHLILFTNVKRRLIISLFGMRWDIFVSPDMLQYEVMKSPMGWLGAALL